MKYYSRRVIKRIAINRFGRLGYVPHLEVVLTDDITPFNFRKQYKFTEMGLDEVKTYDNERIEPNKVYSFKQDY